MAAVVGAIIGAVIVAVWKDQADVALLRMLTQHYCVQYYH